MQDASDGCLDLALDPVTAAPTRMTFVLCQFSSTFISATYIDV